MTITRHPAGTEQGGRFAPKHCPESRLDLGLPTQQDPPTLVGWEAMPPAPDWAAQRHPADEGPVGDDGGYFDDFGQREDGTPIDQMALPGTLRFCPNCGEAEGSQYARPWCVFPDPDKAA